MAPEPEILLIISAHNPQKTYFPGQIVAGKVCFNLNSQLEMQGLHLKFFGQAKVNFTKDRRVTRWFTKEAYYDQTIHYSAKEEFLKYNLHIGIKDQIILPAGFHDFPFSFAIPLGLPSSYIGIHGSVTYHLCLDANIKEKNGHTSKVENQVVLSINGDMDLINEPADVKLPIEISIIKKTSFGFGKSGPISFKIKIPKKGFTPGESIPFLVEINNCSRKTLNSMEMALIQKIEYHGIFEGWSGNGPRESEFASPRECGSLSEIIVQKIVPGVAKGDSGSWDSGNSFKIPTNLPPTKLAGCKLINIQYTLHFEAVFDLNKKISKDIPIIIGTTTLGPPSYAEANLEKIGNTHGDGPADQI